MSRLRVLHLCTSFDPAGDVVRCFGELQKYSAHEHRLLVREKHPKQEVYRFPEPEWLGPFIPMGQPEKSVEWSNCVLYHFTGPKIAYHLGAIPGWGFGDKPAGFRNLNIYYRPGDDRFFTVEWYNAPDLSIFKLVSSSHVGARQFLGSGQFRWLPDMIPVDDPAYMPAPEVEREGVSFLKHAEYFRAVDFGALKVDVSESPLSRVLERKRSTVAIDNVCDGHYGLAGLECLSMGLPTIVYNHPATREALSEIAPTESPFCEVERPAVELAINAARELLADPERAAGLGRRARDWMVEHHNSASIIKRYWDPFFEELTGAA